MNYELWFLSLKPKIFYLLLLYLCCLFFLPQNTQAYSPASSASIVMGQINFTGSGPSLGSQRLNGPTAIATDGVYLAVADSGNNRVLIYSSIPGVIYPIADVVIGQQDFVSGGVNQNGATAGNTLDYPTQIDFANGRLLVTDTDNNRILIFSKLPKQNNAKADFVIGQTDMSGSTGTASATQLNLPSGVAYDVISGKLAIADTGNNRILLYNNVPTNNNTAADVVLGQTNFTGSGADARPDALSSPHGVKFINGKLVVTDSGNNRVLIWNTLPTTSGQAADIVIGQTNFTNNNTNQGGSAGANTLDYPTDTTFDGTRFIISDEGNNRLLIFNTMPSSSNPNADQVLGQANFANTNTNSGTNVSGTSLNSPNGLASLGRTLFVCDTTNNRVLFFYNYSSTTAMSLSNSPLGQPNGFLRMYGNITLTNYYKVQSMQFQVNTSDWQAATAVDGGFDDSKEDFYVNYDPNSNKKGDGYTLRVRATNSNNDLLDNLFYFEPFKINAPNNGYTANELYPLFDFSINKQIQTLSDNLSNYQIWIKRPGLPNWSVYLSGIPIDFNLVRLNSENLKRSDYSLPTHNGIYETTTMSVVYSFDSSRIIVRGKNIQWIPGTYLWKIVAVDKAGHTQDSEQRTIITTTKTKMSNTQFFPLAILFISGIGDVNLTSYYPWKIKTLYTTNVQNPTIYGIAPRNALVSLSITDLLCKEKLMQSCIQVFTTTANSDSRFGINLPNNFLKQNQNYTLSLSEVLENNYNELPVFNLKVDFPRTIIKNAPSSIETFQGDNSINVEDITPTPTKKKTQIKNNFCIFKFCFNHNLHYPFIPISYNVLLITNEIISSCPLTWKYSS